MDQHTRIDLTMMSLELRLAARGPAHLVGQRLTPQRLLDIASALEHLLDASDHGTARGADLAGNRRGMPMRASSVEKLLGRA